MGVKYTITLLAITAISGLPALAQKAVTFAERPELRDQKVAQMKAEDQERKAETERLVALYGLQTRFEFEGGASELIEFRDGRPVYYMTENDDAAISTAANLVRDTAPYNVDGSGFTVGVWDGGTILYTHQEFAGGRVTRRNMVASHSHATHVGGTIGAAGVVARAEGMAPGCHLDSYHWNDDTTEMTAAAAATPQQSGKIMLSNHSYGFVTGWAIGDWSGNFGYHFFGNISNPQDERFGQYDWKARQVDEIVYNAPYFLPFKSAGNDRIDSAPSSGTTFYYSPNTWQPKSYTSGDPLGDGVYKDGYDTISGFANAKNIMTVGSVTDAVVGSSRNPEVSSLSSFTSWGPSDDGRIKPDIVANGQILYSTYDGNNTDYDSISGTSMSSPNACGSAALLVDYYDSLYPGAAMRASTLKGLIIHTADDMGRPGPDYSYGWGLMNTLEAALLLKKYSEGDTIRMREDEIDEGETDSLSFTWNAASHIRVTLCWTDPAGSSTTAYDDRTPDLVNDLDLRVIGPGGTYYPYKLSYSNPSANATTGENDVDNVEQVYIETPTPGTYTVEVHYDGSTENPAQAQWYSLLVTGNVAGQPDADGDGIPDDWEIQYFGGATNALATADPDGDGADNLTEYIAGTDPNNANSVFEVTNHSAPNGSITDFELDWGPTTNGRIYSVSWTDHLIIKPFSVIASNLPPSQTSFIDTAPRTGKQNYYRVEVTKP